MDINITQLRALYDIAAKNGRLDLYAALALDWAEQADDFIKILRGSLAKRTARLQIIKEFMTINEWELFLVKYPDAKNWFDEDGVAK